MRSCREKKEFKTSFCNAPHHLPFPPCSLSDLLEAYQQAGTIRCITCDWATLSIIIVFQHSQSVPRTRSLDSCSCVAHCAIPCFAPSTLVGADCLNCSPLASSPVPSPRSGLSVQLTLLFLPSSLGVFSFPLPHSINHRIGCEQLPSISQTLPGSVVYRRALFSESHASPADRRLIILTHRHPRFCKAHHVRASRATTGDGAIVPSAKSSLL